MCDYDRYDTYDVGCTTCGGSGADIAFASGRVDQDDLQRGSGEVDCSTCGGSGEEDCPYCNGTGEEDCRYCNGSGQIYVPDPTYNFTLSYNANNGSGAPSNQTKTSTSTSYTFTISTTIPTRDGYIFVEWNTNSAGTGIGYDPGDKITIGTGTTTLYAIWQQAAIDITTSQGDVSLITGQEFTLNIGTSVSGCTISVSGASWLSSSGNMVSGTAPSSPGEYDITITASKSGYISDSINFSITVVSALSFDSEPSTGATAYVIS